MRNNLTLLNKDDIHSSLITYTIKWFLLVPIVIGFLLRIILLFSPQTQISFSFFEWIDIFVLGLINDACVALVCSIFIILCLITLNNKKYERPWGYIILSVLLIAFCYLCFFHDITDDYGSAVPKIVKGLCLYKIISFSIRLFIPSIRKNWSYAIYAAFTFLTLFILLVSTLGEYFFWDEFGVRYNFIAVDYLIYTHEVVGNILESYAIIPLFSIIALIVGTITWIIVRHRQQQFGNYPSLKSKSKILFTYFILFIVAIFQLSMAPRFEHHSNIYVNELQANGIHKFYRAFFDNKLNYKDFYALLSEKQAIETINDQYASHGIYNQHDITSSEPEIHKNIILITEESLSASYLAHYGNDKNLTPNLDKLINESFSFDSLFAAGNRTVRGLEALTLCKPPCPGESIIKQDDNGNLFNVGTILRSKGYLTQFLYGGDAYFDNMSTFYKSNGYEIIDKKDFDSSKIHFSNIWGVCDEDIFSKAVEVMRNNSKSGKPSFLHIMTVSNHRPFTYPDNRIDIPSNKKSREGGVKYADYAIGQFIAEASKEPWFKNTIIVIVADHCSSSAGKTSIPLDKYLIPAIIYAPGFIQQQSYKGIASQIDIMPTVFGMLHLNYTSYFYGQDVLSASYKPRAFMATYQSLGYLENDRLVVLSTDRKVTQYAIACHDHTFVQKKVDSNDNNLSLKAVANYQMTSTYFKKER
jgi:phosphoglycerol transferase MdoB-like AlkP superfamily enzyme